QRAHCALRRTRARSRARRARLWLGQRTCAGAKRGKRMSSVQTWVNNFAAREHGSIPWLAALRQRAIDRFAAEGWPTTKQEDWRHTSLAVLEPLEFGPAGTASPLELVKALRHGEAGHWLVFVDGKYAPALSEVGSLPAGARVQAWSETLADTPDDLQEIF